MILDLDCISLDLSFLTYKRIELGKKKKKNLSFRSVN